MSALYSAKAVGEKRMNMHMGRLPAGQPWAGTGHLAHTALACSGQAQLPTAVLSTPASNPTLGRPRWDGHGRRHQLWQCLLRDGGTGMAPDSPTPPGGQACSVTPGQVQPVLSESG